MTSTVVDKFSYEIAAAWITFYFKAPRDQKAAPRFSPWLPPCIEESPEGSTLSRVSIASPRSRRRRRIAKGPCASPATPSSVNR